MTGTKTRPLWADTSLEPDPALLPATFGVPCAAHEAWCNGEIEYAVDSEKVTIRRIFQGTPVEINRALSDYEGLAALLFEPTADKAATIALVLVHSDPFFNVPLYVTCDSNRVVKLWQAWSEALNVPLLLEQEDGTFKQCGGKWQNWSWNQSAPRRLYSFFAERRPRFLTRRKVGKLAKNAPLQGREITAYP